MAFYANQNAGVESEVSTYEESAEQAAEQAQQLLWDIGFDGLDELPNKKKDLRPWVSYAGELLAVLDAYNNNFPLPPVPTP